MIILLALSPKFKIKLLIVMRKENKKYSTIYHFTDKQLSSNMHNIQNDKHSMFK